MFSRLVILPYKLGSRSAKALALGLSSALNLRVRRVGKPNGRYRPKQRSLIINYGSSIYPPTWTRVNAVNLLNSPEACAIAGNKLRAFQAFQQHGVSIPEWTTETRVANQWLNVGSTVVCRTLLNAHSGRGIILANSSSIQMLPIAPLYVKYKKKKREFRVHVFAGNVIDIAEKRRMRMERRPEAFDGYIRNHSNGWIFARNDIIVPQDLETESIAAVRACGLDFGAVDIIWNERENKSYVLEVNTAPGLEGTTLEIYKQAFLSWIRNK